MSMTASTHETNLQVHSEASLFLHMKKQFFVDVLWNVTTIVVVVATTKYPVSMGYVEFRIYKSCDER